MSDWTNSHDLVYAFVCVSFLADGEVDESEKEAMRGNVKVMLPDMGDDEYHQVEKEVIDKFIALGDETSRFGQYGSSLSAIKEMFSSDDDRYKVIKNLAYIARADQFIHENEMKMVEQAVTDLDMEDKVSLVKTESTLFVDFKSQLFILNKAYQLVPDIHYWALTFLRLNGVRNNVGKKNAQ